MKAVYAMDPLALCRHHMDDHLNHCYDGNGVGCTPSHLLCLAMMTESTKKLVLFFSLSSPQSFTMNVRHRYRSDGRNGDPERPCGALHVACGYGQPTEWLLQQLLQLDSSVCKIKPDGPLFFTPLGTLCKYKRVVDVNTER